MNLNQEALKEFFLFVEKIQPNPMKRCLFLCNRTSNIMIPWAESGHTCVAIDLQHDGIQNNGNFYFVGANVFDLLLALKSQFYFGFGFPDCSHLCIGGAAWWKKKGPLPLIEGLRLVRACENILDSNCKIWAIENPRGRLKDYWRRPDYDFHPCHFGDNYTKLTCLWTSKTFTMPVKKWKEPDHSNAIFGSMEGKDNRSITPFGFCRAVYEANKT